MASDLQAHSERAEQNVERHELRQLQEAERRREQRQLELSAAVRDRRAQGAQSTHELEAAEVALAALWAQAAGLWRELHAAKAAKAGGPARGRSAADAKAASAASAALAAEILAAAKGPEDAVWNEGRAAAKADLYRLVHADEVAQAEARKGQERARACV